VRLANEHERFLGGFGHITRLEGDDIGLDSIGFIKNTCWFGDEDLGVETNNQANDTEDYKRNAIYYGNIQSIPHADMIGREHKKKPHVNHSHSLSPATKRRL